MVFSPDGERIASVGDENEGGLWNVHDGKCVKILKGHTARIMSVSFSPDGRKLVSGGSDETIRLWDVGTGECLMTLKAEKPYKGMNIAGATGLTEAQKAAVRELGGVP